MAARPPARGGRLEELLIVAAAVVFTFIVGRALIIALGYPSVPIEVLLFLVIYVASFLALSRAVRLAMRR